VRLPEGEKEVYKELGPSESYKALIDYSIANSTTLRQKVLRSGTRTLGPIQDDG
jgi:hypothetical protein